MLESAIAAGVTAAGGDALLAGVLPTPAAPLLVRRHGLDLAAVISASHNPYEDNGIKLFAADGFKLHDDTEHAIEAELDSRRRHRRASAASAASTARSRTICASSIRASPSSTCAGAGSCSTAPTAPPSGLRPRSSAASGRRST